MKDFLIGHAGNEQTGCTVVYAPKGAVGGVSVKGGAPATRETALFDSHKMIQAVHAVVLSGGSAYGLEAGCGVMEYLRDRGIGFPIAGKVVPIVGQASLFDLGGEGYNYPDKAMAIRACEQAFCGNFASGKIGAGIGAKIGKILGAEGAMQGGIGVHDSLVGQTRIVAIMAVNAFGDVYDFESGKIVAGVRDKAGNFLDTQSIILAQSFRQNPTPTNTTIGVILTDASLTKIQANKLASIAHNGLAQSIVPVHTDFDGDTIFALASGETECNFTALCVGAVECVRQAVIKAVRYE